MNTTIRRVFFCLVVLSLAAAAGAGIVADHSVVATFDQIPDSAIQQAAAIRLMFRHASVGTTVDGGLDCVQGTRNNPTECTTYLDYRYDRRNWTFQPRGNSGWYGKVDDFVTETRNQITLFDAFSFKYCYLDGLDGLMEPCGSTFNPAEADQAFEYLRSNMEMLGTENPGKTFIWWTIPLTQPGQYCTEYLNAAIRGHVTAIGGILFDIADIECHDPGGNRMTSVDGWEVAYAPYCGEAPPGPSCHPNWTGSIMLAKAHWWMMARIAGWDNTTPGRIGDLRMLRIGADVEMHWTPDPLASGGYHAYQTDIAADASLMRDSHPSYDAFASVSSPPHVYAGGVSAGLRYYQVLGVASDGITEGAN